MRIGLPQLLTTDQGTEFKNEVDKQMMKPLGIKRIFTTSYHPQVSLSYRCNNLNSDNITESSVFHCLTTQKI